MAGGRNHFRLRAERQPRAAVPHSYPCLSSPAAKAPHLSHGIPFKFNITVVCLWSCTPRPLITPATHPPPSHAAPHRVASSLFVYKCPPVKTLWRIRPSGLGCFLRRDMYRCRISTHRVRSTPLVRPGITNVRMIFGHVLRRSPQEFVGGILEDFSVGPILLPLG